MSGRLRLLLVGGDYSIAKDPKRPTNATRWRTKRRVFVGIGRPTNWRMNRHFVIIRFLRRAMVTNQQMLLINKISTAEAIYSFYHPSQSILLLLLLLLKAIHPPAILYKGEGTPSSPAHNQIVDLHSSLFFFFLQIATTAESHGQTAAASSSITFRLSARHPFLFLLIVITRQSAIKSGIRYWQGGSPLKAQRVCSRMERGRVKLKKKGEPIKIITF